MAGDDNEVQHDASGPVGAPESHGPKPGGTAPSPIAEWTASDTRGALNEAGATPVAGDAYTASGSGPARLHEFSEPTPHAAVDDAPPPASPVIPDTVPSPRKASLWPVAAGIVLGAVIGAGSAFYVYSTTADGSVEPQVAALTGRVDALEKRPDAQQAVAPLKASLANLAGKVAAIDATARSPSAAPQAAGIPPVAGAAAAPDPTLAALQQKVAALQAALGTMQQQAAASSDLKAAQSKLAAVEASVAGVQKQASATQGDVQSLQSGQKSLEGKITSAPALAVVADSLVEQINRGLPFASQVNALDSLGVDPAKIAVLRQSADHGVPSAAVLATKFEPLTDDLLSAGYKAKPNASFWDRMKDGAGSLVSIRRIDDVDGPDTPSRVARIKADLARNDVIDAVATWNLLPPEAKAKPDAAAWGALAKTHADAKTAANAVEHDAIAALSTKKS
ncbi:COG4223 family protein [Beijerinckia sp. L45]|uniref:COG4223 family protein n=1 Tax=Beijerinckia sp. L45 TaxID=1641855 RepID=UPI00131B0E41|nr:hypothetical protein [Beijerinckia sp. L45]